MLSVSDATIRRDLNELDSRKQVKRTHGGVTLADSNDELPYHSKLRTLLDEKRRIGAMVTSMLEPNMVVGCTGGTTIAQVVRALRSRPVHPLRIVTNAVNIAAELAIVPHIEVMVTGGLLRERTYELIGHVAERTLEDVVLDRALVGVDGVSTEYGLTTYNPGEAYVMRRLIERAKEVWVAADHSKLGQSRPAIIGPLDSVTRLITDTQAPPNIVAELRGRGIDVILV